MEDDEGLFGDLGYTGPEIIVGGGGSRSRYSSLDQNVDEAWELWSRVTNRPSPSSVPDRFRKEYKELLNMKYSQDRLLRCVSAAAHIPPRARDPRDIKRLLDCLWYDKMEATALSLLDKAGSPVYLWQWDEAENLSSAEDVARLTGIDVEMWTSKEQESCGVLIQTLTPDRLEFAIRRTKLVVGRDEVFPSEVIRESKHWRAPDAHLKIAVNQKRDSYGAGAAESTALEGADLDLDILAEKLLIKGCPADLVRRYHDAAPDGYWDSVDKVLDGDPKMSLTSVYQEVADKFQGWAPESREVPSW